ncbi:ZIP family metal transporter [Nitratireductor sp. StC3]|uniref:ZIP family metal transporter n=1 Tax=Nitratireductor sp. StC3 TaxID=2126741 RepID=UPI000D0CCD27|nr:ZIP family metal transporter [Nitratireductor sp. StC3]PSM18094.1 ZIP family metal transporter [Nitratireductor sp. StC3]
MTMDADVVLVFLAAMTTAVTTGLGALPFVFVKRIDRWRLSIANAVAAGLMLGASYNLIDEGADIALDRVLIGILLGLAAILAANRLLRRRDTADIADLHGRSATRALLILGVMTAHSFAEGIGVGVSFAGTPELGAFITTAIAIHNIPEGLAICLVLIPRGTSIWKASLWSIFTSLPQPLMAVPAFLFVQSFEPFLPIGLGIAAGAMIWMVFSELIPDATENASGDAVGTTVVLAIVALWAFQLVLFGTW